MSREEVDDPAAPAQLPTRPPIFFSLDVEGKRVSSNTKYIAPRTPSVYRDKSNKVKTKGRSKMRSTKKKNDDALLREKKMMMSGKSAMMPNQSGRRRSDCSIGERQDEIPGIFQDQNNRREKRLFCENEQAATPAVEPLTITSAQSSEKNRTYLSHNQQSQPGAIHVPRRTHSNGSLGAHLARARTRLSHVMDSSLHRSRHSTQTTLLPIAEVWEPPEESMALAVEIEDDELTGESNPSKHSQTSKRETTITRLLILLLIGVLAFAFSGWKNTKNQQSSEVNEPTIPITELPTQSPSIPPATHDKVPSSSPTQEAIASPTLRPSISTLIPTFQGGMTPTALPVAPLPSVTPSPTSLSSQLASPTLYPTVLPPTLTTEPPTRWPTNAPTPSSLSFQTPTQLKIFLPDIPDDLDAAQNLTRLDQFTVGNPNGAIPSDIALLTNLRSISLTSPSLTGTIPTEIGTLTQLTELAMDQNSLTGQIPTEIGWLTNLKILWVSSNSLTGTFATEIGALTQLTTLYLNRLDLSGSLPREIGQLTAMAHLVFGAFELLVVPCLPYEIVCKDSRLCFLSNQRGML